MSSMHKHFLQPKHHCLLPLMTLKDAVSPSSQWSSHVLCLSCSVTDGLRTTVLFEGQDICVSVDGVWDEERNTSDG